MQSNATHHLSNNILFWVRWGNSKMYFLWEKITTHSGIKLCLKDTQVNIYFQFTKLSKRNIWDETSLSWKYAACDNPQNNVFCPQEGSNRSSLREMMRPVWYHVYSISPTISFPFFLSFEVMHWPWYHSQYPFHFFLSFEMVRPVWYHVYSISPTISFPFFFLLKWCTEYWPWYHSQYPFHFLSFFWNDAPTLISCIFDLFHNNLSRSLHEGYVDLAKALNPRVRCAFWTIFLF